MALTTAEVVRLAKLKEAYDKLIMGKAVQEVESDGERMRWMQPTEANIKRLEREISALESKASGTVTRQRGALRFSV